MKKVLFLGCLLLLLPLPSEGKRWGFPRCQDAAQLASVLAHVPESKVSNTIKLWHWHVENTFTGKDMQFVKEAKHAEIEEARGLVERLRSHGYDDTAIGGLAFHHCAL